MVHGIGQNNCDWFGQENNDKHKHHNDCNLQQFCFESGEVDILLDCDHGILRICLVGNKRLIDANKMLDKYIADTSKRIIENEACLWNLQTGDECKGWVPHIILWSAGVQCRIAQIDPHLFGVKDVDIFQDLK